MAVVVNHHTGLSVQLLLQNQPEGSNSWQAEGCHGAPRGAFPPRLGGGSLSPRFSSISTVDKLVRGARLGVSRRVGELFTLIGLPWENEPS